LDSVTPWIITSGLCCVVPTAALLTGIWIGRKGIRLRNPFYSRKREDVVGYK
jgi:hypothetical protein